MVKNRTFNSFRIGFLRYIKRYNFLGIVLALCMLCLSLTPSLLPRPWLMQGFISGISMAIGYGLGTLSSLLIRWFVQRELPSSIKTPAWKLLWITLPLAYIAFIFLGQIWQNDVRRLIGEAPLPGSHLIGIGIVAVLVFVFLISLARLIRIFVRFMQRKIDIFLPRRLSYAVAICIGVGLIYWIVSGLLLSTAISYARNHYAIRNKTTPVGISQPTSSFRSGSSASLIPWNTLGYQGQSFVASGPTQEQMTKLSGKQSIPQIRLYAGLDSAQTAEGRAKLVVQEMQRTGAFNRKVIILATTTGTGWLEEQSVDSLEYIYNGDSAIVTQQYSDLPSWISFLVDQPKATEAAQKLYDAVYAQWSTLPKSTRPKLIAYGLSLGSFGGQSAYSSAQDMALSVDGALFEGTPSATKLWQDITVNRDPGSPEWQPIYQGGKTVRFAATNADINKPSTNWSFPRILYMQHASDPVVWFNFSLPIHMPNWLAEKRGPDVSTDMFWYPLVTFLQITVDEFYGVDAPNGHGHNYPNTIVAAWQAVAPSGVLDTDQLTKLQSIINTYPSD